MRGCFYFASGVIFFFLYCALSQQETTRFCDVPEVKVKIGQRFLLSLQEYVSISHGFPSSTVPMWQPRTSAGQLHSMTCPSRLLVNVVPTPQSRARTDGFHHLASFYGHLDLARLLVEHDANPAAQDEDGLTPLHLAPSNYYLDLARFLIEQTVCNYSWSPFYCAVDQDRDHLCRCWRSLACPSISSTAVMSRLSSRYCVNKQDNAK